MVKQINLDILRKIIHKYKKYLDPPLVGTGAGSRISECIRSKGVEEKESQKLKGNFVCLPK